MTSKEALERYYSNLLYGNGGFQTDEEELEALNTIKQDLERKEVLELNLDSEKYHLVNKNQCLKNRVKDLEICYKERIKENQELLIALENKNKEIENLKKLINDNPYKKAIDILKNRLTIEFDDKYNEVNFKLYACKEFDYVYFSFDDKSQYELLKEILKR